MSERSGAEDKMTRLTLSDNETQPFFFISFSDACHLRLSRKKTLL